ncbi:MAG: type II toxin-antitoxin system VapC family toxin [Herminiimonas sp.]|nr:type II toxin-antitoxin system VapC family toxin [Herminiimonas sp.]
MYLIDTNVISELRKGERAHAGVVRFLRTVDPDSLFLPVQTLGELRKGAETIRLCRDIDQAQRLEQWLDQVVQFYGDRILDFDHECAQMWGRLLARSPQHPIDRQIAAIALLYDFTVVTRNTADFDGTGVRLINPFVDH